MKASNFESGEWIPTSGWGFVMEDLEQDESVLGLVLFFDNGLIDFEPCFNFRGNTEMGRDWLVYKFQVIKR